MARVAFEKIGQHAAFSPKFIQHFKILLQNETSWNIEVVIADGRGLGLGLGRGLGLVHGLGLDRGLVHGLGLGLGFGLGLARDRGPVHGLGLGLGRGRGHHPWKWQLICTPVSRLLICDIDEIRVETRHTRARIIQHRTHACIAQALAH